MSPQPVSVKGRLDATELRNELLGRLGLRATASDADVETAHNGLVEFLELAPHEVKSWAAARTTDVDEAFALLSGPEQSLVTETQIAATATAVPRETSRPAGPPAAVAAADKKRRTQILGTISAVLVVGVVLGVFFMGKDSAVPGISGTPTNQQTSASGGATSAPLDQAKVAALMQKITANPNDIASLSGLGDLYFASADYKNASLWESKILAVDPKNQKGLLALGAAQFNLGNSAEAKKHWLVAAKLYPQSAEVHYDLGFLYMSQTPPDKANMTAEWKKVVAIDPNSDLAKTVTQHLGSTAPTATSSAK